MTFIQHRLHDNEPLFAADQHSTKNAILIEWLSYCNRLCSSHARMMHSIGKRLASNSITRPGLMLHALADLLHDA
jgi:hypothetical protein